MTSPEPKLTSQPSLPSGKNGGKICEALILEARERGLRHFFGVPGGGSPLDIIEAGRRNGVDFITVAHESSAAIMAGYYGVQKKTAGLALAIRGPGAANLAGGVANLWFERVPLVAVCDAAPEAWCVSCVQSLNHRELFRPITKWNMTLNAVSALSAIRHAFTSATDGIPGPVFLDLPADVTDASDGPLGLLDTPAADSNACTVADAVEFLTRFRHPVILAGADVARCGACGQLARFVESIGAVVLTTMDARGVFPESHPRWAGVYTGKFNPNVIESKVLAMADGVMIVGVDQMMSETPWRSPLPVCDLSVRPGPTLARNPAVHVVGNLASVLNTLAEQVRQPGISPSSIRQAREDILKYFRRPGEARFTAQDVIAITRRLLPEEGILLSETGAHVCMLEHLWPVNRFGTFLGTSGGRTMGLMVPAALGSRLADPKTPMVGVGGDGSLLMRLGELEVFARTKASMPLVILNDGALGTMKSRQKSRGFTDYAMDFAPTDLAGVAEKCGINGVRVGTPEEYESALKAALTAGKATLIDARIDPAAYHRSFAPTIGVLDEWKDVYSNAGAAQKKPS